MAGRKRGLNSCVSTWFMTLGLQLCILNNTIQAASLNSSTSSGSVFNSTMSDNTTNITTPHENKTLRVGDLPENWDSFCTTAASFVKWNFTSLSHSEVQHLLQISCFLDDQSHLYFSDFRDWQSRRLNGNKVAIQVTCNSNSRGYFHVPWPMKVLDLAYIEITGCVLPDYYSEYYDTSVTEFPDQLRVLETRDCTVPLALPELLVLIMSLKNSTRESECGPTTVEKMVIAGFKTDIASDDYDDDLPIPDTGASSIPGDVALLDVDTQSEQLWTDSNRLAYICEFDYLRYLEESGWDLSGQHVFHAMKKSVFPVLEVYNLSYIGLEHVPKELTEWRGFLRNLDYLDLSHNDINNFQFTDRGLKEDGIGSINLQNNSISVLTKRDLDTFDRLESVVIDVRNNPINCSCGLLVDLYKYLQSPNLGYYEYLRDLKCFTPLSLRDRTLGSLTEMEIQCKEPLYILLAVLTVSVIILLVVIFVIIKYRREVVILVYTRLHIVLPCRPIECEEDKDYDAFISYSSKDDNWVLPNLVQALETGKNDNHVPLKLCVHHRDFEIGAAISENVVKSVESSRHTILVLSRNYVESEWCIYEFRTALYQSLLERKKHLIVIVLEDVPKAELDVDLRKCLETFTYIPVGDKLFWDKIIYALTIGKNNKASRASKKCIPERLPLESQSCNSQV